MADSPENKSIDAIDASSQLQELDSEVESLVSETPSESIPPIDVTYAKQSTALGKLLGDDEYSINLRNQTYSLRFNEKVYVDFVDLTFEGRNSANVPLFVSDLLGSGDPAEISGVKQGEQTRRYVVRKVISELSVKGRKKLFGELRLSAIHISGLHAKDLRSRVEFLEGANLRATALRQQFSKLAQGVQAKIDDLKQLELHEQDLEQRIEALEASHDENEARRDSAQSARDAANKQQKAAEQATKDARDTLNSLNDNITQQGKLRNNLNSEITNLRSTLKELTDNKNIFTEEVGTFNLQSNEQRRIYSVFALLPLLVLAILAVKLYLQSQEYLVPDMSWESALNIFFSRLPTLFAYIAAAWALYKIASIFIQKVIEIDRQQLAFSKIAIIAREVAEAASDGLELTPEQEHDRRVLLKMSLLKAHMKEELGKSFDYAKLTERKLRDVSLINRLLSREKGKPNQKVDGDPVDSEDKTNAAE